MTTNVANPILYAWLNPTFKEMFLRTANPLLLRRKKRRGQSAQVRGAATALDTARGSQSTKSRLSSAQTSSLGEGRLLVHLNTGDEKSSTSRKDFF